jgi:hypothetical protein
VRRRTASGPRRAALVFGLLMLPPAAGASPLDDQGAVQGTNLLLYEFGRDPTQEAQDRTKLFDQLRVDYLRGDFRLGLRVESFRDSVEPHGSGSPDYSELTQRYVEWADSGARLRVGNGYAILGRGLLFRAFELPGVVRAAAYPPAYYGESRDLDGVVLEVQRGPLALTGVSGRPVISPQYPHGTGGTPFDRRGGTLSGTHVALSAGRALTAGGAYVRADDILDSGVDDGVGSGTEDQGALDLLLRLQHVLHPLARAGIGLELYGEYAGRGWRPLHDGFATDDGARHALYTASQLTWASGGLSFETKRYHQFALGVNDPPAVVPELGELLLNRSTHVLLPGDERGLQLALQQGLPKEWSLEADWARARNRPEIQPGVFDDARAKRYQLVYVAAESSPMRPLRGRLFAGFGQDEAASVDAQRTFGVRAEYAWKAQLGAELSLQHQRVERAGAGGTTEHFDNFAVLAALSKAGVLRVAALLEASNDLGETDDPFTTAVERDPVHWLSLVASRDIGANHQATLTVGKRRGGLACTSGTCYVVPGFDGAELRVVSRF